MDKELVGWLEPESCCQRLCVQVEASDGWCLPGFCLGMGVLLHLRHKSRSTEKKWEFWWTKSWTQTRGVCLQLRRPTVSWAASKEWWQQGEGIVFLYSALMRSLLPGLAHWAQEGCGSIGAGPGEGQGDGGRAGAPLLWRSSGWQTCPRMRFGGWWPSRSLST